MAPAVPLRMLTRAGVVVSGALATLTAARNSGLARTPLSAIAIAPVLTNVKSRLAAPEMMVPAPAERRLIAELLVKAAVTSRRSPLMVPSLVNDSSAPPTGIDSVRKSGKPPPLTG